MSAIAKQLRSGDRGVRNLETGRMGVGVDSPRADHLIQTRMVKKCFARM